MLSVLFAGTASAQTRTLRIVTYNIEADIVLTNIQPTFTNIVQVPGPPLPGLIAPPNDPNDFAAGGVLEGIGEELLNGNAQPLDILALQETTGNTQTVAPIVNALNVFYGVPGMFTNSTYQATESGGNPSTGNGPNALVYNTRTVQLLASTPVDPSGGTTKLGSTSGEYREVMRYKFAPAGVAANASNIFYIYVSHYKASTGAANEAKRLGEAQIIRTNEAIDLPADARVLYVGDFNVTSPGEAGYQTILSNTAPNGIHQGQGIDPLNVTAATNIDWQDFTTDTNILVMLTEASDYLRYRDDLQVMTTNVYHGATGGLKYIPGTYHTFGNNGTTAYYGAASDPGNDSLINRLVTNGPVFIGASQLYIDLTGAADHLPVVADYTIPMPAPRITSFSLVGTNLTITATNGITNAVYVVLMHTNLASPLPNWSMVATCAATGGVFTVTATNAASKSVPGRFYILEGK